MKPAYAPAVDPARSRELDQRLVVAAREIRVLSSLSWPEGTIEAFLASWRAGDPKLPDLELAPHDLRAERAALDSIARDADPDDPLQAFVARTARSYSTAARMLEVIGTPAFTELSCEIYGTPDATVPGAAVTHREIAERLLANTDDLCAAGVLTEEELCLSAEAVRAELEQAFATFFGEHAPEVKIDPNLGSKATAGSRRVRLRGNTRFSRVDVDQLREHEGFVHAATALNGRAQTTLSCMGLNAPRTTLTQEGLATYAEVVTNSLDIARLRRLALRTLAIHAGLAGADYIEVFHLFLEGGQSPDESAHSAMRVFRGSDVRGRAVFTKDVVYLCGLIAVHTFLRKAIAEGRPELVRHLFCGRLALPDVLALEPAFASEHLVEPPFVPPWATELHRLSAHLAFSAVIDQVDLRAVELDALL